MLTLPVLHRSQDRNHFPISIFIAPTYKATDHSGVLQISFSRKLTAVLEESNSACLFQHKFITELKELCIIKAMAVLTITKSNTIKFMKTKVMKNKRARQLKYKCII